MAAEKDEIRQEQITNTMLMTNSCFCETGHVEYGMALQDNKIDRRQESEHDRQHGFEREHRLACRVHEQQRQGHTLYIAPAAVTAKH